MADNKYLRAAIKYATKYGWAVFPVNPKTKKPLTPHGCKDAKKGVGPITAWWRKWPNAGVGVATGSASNIIVIDEDMDPDKGIDGCFEMNRWEKENGELPETPRALTGRGGVHLYYHYTGTDIKNRAGILDGVDVRGEGGYIIAPPSLHPNGTEYQWEEDPEETPFSEVTDAVRQFLKIGKTSREERSEPFELPSSIPFGKRNETLFKLACSLQAQGLPDAAISAAVAQVNDNACVAPVEDDEVDAIVGSALQYEKGRLAVMAEGSPEWHEPKLAMMKDKDGVETDKPAQTIANAEEAIRFDKELFERLAYNDLTFSPYVYGNLPWRDHRGWREWDNVDDSQLRSYIERKYHLKSPEKVMDALQNVISKRVINPIKKMLEDAHERWDGNRHIENLLPAMMGSDKTEYTIEVMKLFLLGAIARIYSPGCKYDYVPILIGDQGIGKSTFLRLLAIDEKFFTDSLGALEGDKAKESLRGAWIVELSELLAMKRTKDVEATKSFITSREDVYRAPYQRRTERRDRRCVFAGTTNNADFLTDRTGNRRFLPIECGKNPITIDIFKDEDFAKSEILQAWGEAMDIYLHAGKKIRLVLPKHLQQEAMKAQENYLEEDPWIGMIQEWLDSNIEVNRVCVIMLWREALGHLYDEPKRAEINSLHSIMKKDIRGWYPNGKQSVGKYGIQRCYERNLEHGLYNNFEDDENYDIPFDN
jgi:predicted P-loop ATPase